MVEKENFDVLIDKYHERIFHLCLGIVHDRNLAEDLVQETFLQAYHHFEELRDKSRAQSWLYRIAKNLSFTLLRKNRSKGQDFSLREEITPGKNLSSIESKEMYGALFEAMSILSPEQRAVFELHEIEKNSHKQIAYLLHIPEGTSRSRLYSARRKIRGILESKGFD